MTDTQDLLATAVHEGRVAAFQGKPVDQCPYGPADSLPARSWVAGWHEGQRRADAMNTLMTADRSPRILTGSHFFFNQFERHS